jgi:23S rRNA-/tRNA-specific pseudouridylate synthase
LGDGCQNPLYADEAGLAAAARLLLHACKLTVMHPESGQQITWQSACPF